MVAKFVVWQRTSLIEWPSYGRSSSCYAGSTTSLPRAALALSCYSAHGRAIVLASSARDGGNVCTHHPARVWRSRCSARTPMLGRHLQSYATLTVILLREPRIAQQSLLAFFQLNLSVAHSYSRRNRVERIYSGRLILFFLHIKLTVLQILGSGNVWETYKR